MEELPFINEEYIDKQIEPLANIHRGDQDNVNVLIGSSSMNWKLNFSDEVYKTCYICFYQFFGLHQLTKHLRLHISGPYSCLECSKQVPTGLSLHEHFRNHFKGSIQNDNNIAKTSTITTNKCKECHEDFKSNTGLLKHYAEKHAMITTTKQNMYHCTDCTFICYNAKGFRKHMQERHNKKPFPCQQCGISYNHKANLEDHIKAKHSSKEYPCDKCGKVFNKKASLFVHRREQHELGDSRKIKCDICSLELKGKRNLKKHKETHMNENDLSLKKKYQCLYCQKHFRTRNSVNVHHRTHTGETPYRCHLCSKNFKRSHHLSSHLKCADHLSKIQQQSSNLPQPVYSISKSNDLDFNQHQATTSDVTELIFTVGGDDDDDVCVSKSYQVVVPSELNPTHQHPGTMTTDQLLQSALVLQESTDYQTFATTE